MKLFSAALALAVVAVCLQGSDGMRKNAVTPKAKSFSFQSSFYPAQKRHQLTQAEKDIISEVLATLQAAIDALLQSITGEIGSIWAPIQAIIDQILASSENNKSELQRILVTLKTAHEKKTSVAKGIKQSDPLEELLALLEQGIDGILAIVDGSLEDALIYLQNLVDMVHELQEQSAEGLEQQLIDMILQSLGTLLGQIEDLLGITSRKTVKMASLFHSLRDPKSNMPRNVRVFKALQLRKMIERFMQKDALDDLMALLEQGLDGILAMVDQNLHDALQYVLDMLDMLHELSLGTLLGQIEDMLGITP
ncbi:unnamed protein product [Notodromas monacha]|uniref:Uncharacterized protein n=1 Tax=Notodromas monacha TaxID=399045 RepID=A0A7R9GBU1_9CRUS|nr:unnamed protein product [Notodromas monacha]CAG0915337.1 unnamed protein product [Notodromas monacha]